MIFENVVGLFFQPEILPFNDNTGGFLLSLFQTFVALGIVCALAYIILHWIIPKIRLKKSSGKIIRIIDIVSLESRKNLYIIEVANRYILIATSDTGIYTIGDLNTDIIENLLEEMNSEELNLPNQFLSSKYNLFTKKILKIVNRKNNGK